MILKIDLSVSIHCQKCSTEVLKSATKLTGTDHISVDAEKSIVTIIGDVDPVCVIAQIRKTGKRVEIISVGPPPKPGEKKPQEKKPEPVIIPCSWAWPPCPPKAYVW